MTQWEYKIIDSKDVGGGMFRGPDREKLEAYLNQLGREGWEMVNADFLELDSHLSFLGVAKRRYENRGQAEGEPPPG